MVQLRLPPYPISLDQLLVDDVNSHRMGVPQLDHAVDTILTRVVRLVLLQALSAELRDFESDVAVIFQAVPMLARDQPFHALGNGLPLFLKRLVGLGLGGGSHGSRRQ